MEPSEVLGNIAPFLRLSGKPIERRQFSSPFDENVMGFFQSVDETRLPMVHMFYNVAAGGTATSTLKASLTSVIVAGHQVKLWSYTPEALIGIPSLGIEIRDASEIIPRPLFEELSAKCEIRYFSDIFRYAVLYESGGLWLDCDVILLRPFAYSGDFFLNFEWSVSKNSICGNALFAKARSGHMRRLYEDAMTTAFSNNFSWGDVGPELLSRYVASAHGRELQNWLASPMFFNSINWNELASFDQPVKELGVYLNDRRLYGIHLWNKLTNQSKIQPIRLYSNILQTLRRASSLCVSWQTNTRPTRIG